MPSFKTVFLLAATTLSVFAASNPSAPHITSTHELEWTKDEFEYEHEQKAKIGDYEIKNEQEVEVSKDGVEVENEQEIKGPGFKFKNEQEVEVKKDGIKIESEHKLELGKRCVDCSTIPGIMSNLHHQVTTISDRLSAVVKVNAAVDVSVVTPHLYDLKGVLDNAVSQVKSISNKPLDVILVKEGARVSVSVCATTLFNLFALVCNVLSVAIHAVATVQVTAVLTVIAQISVVLAQLLTVIFNLVGGLKVAFCDLLKANVSIVGIVRALKLVEVIAVVEAYVHI